MARTILDEFLTQPASTRQIRLGHGDIREAVLALGTKDGIQWLEQHIESPIGPDWGRLLRALNPQWADLDRWIRLSKLHCLAAVDVLLAMIPDPYESTKPMLPSGANPAAIESAIAYALEHYGNTRLREGAKQIRHAWPAGQPIRHDVSISGPLREVAAYLLTNDPRLLQEWGELMATMLTPPECVENVWYSLLQFANAKGLIAVVDHRELLDSSISRLRHLPSAKELPIHWESYMHMSYEDLFDKIASEIKKSGWSLVSLDYVEDAYALTFVATDAIEQLESLIASALDDPQRVQVFG